MKAVIKDFSTIIYLNNEEMKENCKIGKGSDTCIWLIAGPKGFECSYLNKNYELLERWKKGETVAKRNGCDKVKNFKPMDYGIGEFEF